MGWWDVIEIGLNVANLAVNIDNASKLEAMRRQGATTAVIQAVLNMLRDQIFTFKQTADSILEKEAESPLMAACAMKILENQLDDSKIATDMFQDLNDKEYVSKAITLIRKNSTRLMDQLGPGDRERVKLAAGAAHRLPDYVFYTDNFSNGKKYLKAVEDVNAYKDRQGCLITGLLILYVWPGIAIPFGFMAIGDSAGAVLGILAFAGWIWGLVSIIKWQNSGVYKDAKKIVDGIGGEFDLARFKLLDETFHGQETVLALQQEAQKIISDFFQGTELTHETAHTLPNRAEPESPASKAPSDTSQAVFQHTAQNTPARVYTTPNGEPHISANAQHTQTEQSEAYIPAKYPGVADPNEKIFQEINEKYLTPFFSWVKTFIAWLWEKLKYTLFPTVKTNIKKINAQHIKVFVFTMLTGLVVAVLGFLMGIFIHRLTNSLSFAIGDASVSIINLDMPKATLLVSSNTPTHEATPTNQTVAEVAATPTTRQKPTATDKPTLTTVPTPTSPPAIGSSLIRTADDMKMMYIPGGVFSMGGNGGEDDELPIHQVQLHSFWMDSTEVTNEMFSKFASETNYQTDAEKSGKSWIFSGGSWVEAAGVNWQAPVGYGSSPLMKNAPVTHISWNDAYAYCKWAEARLPTEAEWERAARGGKDGTTYTWGNESPSCNEGESNGVNFGGCYDNVTPAESFPQNGFGLYDMLGNVWEWNQDWHSDTYYSESPRENPSGPSTGKFRVLRGGSWFNNVDFLRISSRYGNAPDVSSITYGFRCVR